MSGKPESRFSTIAGRGDFLTDLLDGRFTASRCEI